MSDRNVTTAPSETVNSAQATGTGTLVSGKGRLRSVVVRGTGTAGTAVFKDGGAAGTTILTLNTAAIARAHNLDIPGAGIPFDTDLHVTLTNADAVTVIYGNG